MKINEGEIVAEEIFATKNPGLLFSVRITDETGKVFEANDIKGGYFCFQRKDHDDLGTVQGAFGYAGSMLVTMGKTPELIRAILERFKLVEEMKHLAKLAHFDLNIF